VKVLLLTTSKDMANVKVFKSRSDFKVRRSTILVPIERSCQKNTHTKYKSPITYHSKDMANVKVFKKKVKLQGQGVKNFGTNRKVLSYEIHI
jgi:hypothetical protein